MAKKIERIDVIIIAQPWVQCVMYSGKNVENDSRNKKQRGTVAVYSSKSLVKGRFEYCEDKMGIEHEYEPELAGHILGFVDIIDVIPPNSKKVPVKYKKWWIPGAYGYVLSNVRLLKEPIKVNKKDGVVRWWHLLDKDLKNVLKAMTKKEISEFKTFEIPKE
jgi:hypothetical protein